MDWQSWRAQLLRLYRAHIPNVAVLFLFPVSCWSTFSGLRDLMRSTAGLSQLVGLLVAIGLTLGIQLTLLFAVNTLTRSETRWKPFYLAIYLATVFFSVLFGYSFYFQHLRAEEYAREIHETESRRMLEQGLDYQTRFESLSRSLTALSEYSELRSEEENVRGGTCGDNSQTGRGPRARGRAQDAGIFSTYRRQMDQLVAAQSQSITSLSEDTHAFQASNLGIHQANLTIFYEAVQERQKSARHLLGEIRSYLQSRFPEGRYRIEEGGVAYPCSDTRMDQLAGLLAGSSLPDIPAPPTKFLAHNPKIVVQHALASLTGWIPWGTSKADTSSGPAAASTSQRADRLPLLLGLLVDGLILLAAVASYRTGGSRGLLEELHWLDTTPTRLRHRFRKQLALLLKCRPQEALLQAVRLMARYQVSERSRAGSGLSHTRVVALPLSGAFLDSHPELNRLRDLVGLLESLQAAKRHRVVRWSDLPGPLPPGLAQLKGEEKDLHDEALAIYRLSQDVLNDLTREAFCGNDLGAPVESGDTEEEAAPLGFDAV